VLGLDRIALIATTENETELTLDKLQQIGVLRGKNKLVKVLANGEISTAVTIHAHKFSKQAQQKIEAAGGKVVVLGEAATDSGAKVPKLLPRNER